MCDLKRINTTAVYLRGYVLAQVEIDFMLDTYVVVEVEVEGTYTTDWQQDGGYWHDEGFYEYDNKDIKIIDNKNYYCIQLDNPCLLEGEHEITKLKKILLKSLNRVERGNNDR